MKRIILACVAITLLVACGGSNHQQTNHSTPSPPAAAVTSKGYPGVGVVKAIDPKAPSIEIDHGDIEGLMPAMQMEFEVADAAMLNGIAVNDQVDFTVEDRAGTMRITALKKKQ
ncbi:MAG TPA: copper-binding protein [Pyrinomonadaceae bacterium]|nr:copper-binding protein [Pyrinomonadaceae bacterium]